MEKISLLNRIIFLITGHLAGYKVVGGMQPYSELTTLYYTIAFGTLVLSSLLLMLFGFEILKNSGVMIIAAFIPAGLSLGLINQHLPVVHYIYLSFSIFGMAAVIISRYYATKKTAIIILSLVHGISGVILVLLPLFLVIKGIQNISMLLVSVGGVIIGIEGLLQTFLKIGKPIISEQKLYKIFPLVLLSATAAFVAGLHV